MDSRQTSTKGRMFLVATLLCIAASWADDSLQAAKFHALAGLGALPHRSAWIVLPPDPNRRDAVLLGDGTEIARLDSVAWKRFATWRNDSLSSGANGASEHIAIPTTERLVSWILPPSGGGFAASWSTAEAVKSDRWSAWTTEISWLQSIGPYVSLGGGVSMRQQTPEMAGLDASSHVEAAVAACLPVFCWEMRQQAAAYPDAAIFQKNLDTLVRKKLKGDLITRFSGDGSSYWQHTFEAHFGVLHWKGILAPDAWKGLIQQVSLEDLPAGSLRWGASLAWAGDQAMTGFSLATAPWALASWHLGRFRQNLSWEVMRLDLLYARTDQARLGISTNLHFSDPLRGGDSR